MTPDYERALVSNLSEQALKQANTFKRDYIRMKRTRVSGMRKTQAKKKPRTDRQYINRTPGTFAVTESKYFDVEVSAFAVANNNTNWAATNDVIKGTIAIPTEGADINNRVGRKIEVYKIAGRGLIDFPSNHDLADVFPSPSYRCILWVDTQSNGLVIDSSLLMEPGTAATPIIPFCAFQNKARFGRFRVLKDWIIDAPNITSAQDNVAAGNSTSSQSAPQLPFKFSYKFKTPLVIKYNATNGGTIGDVVDNAVYFSIQKSATLYGQTVTLRTRTYYKDR